MPLGRLVAGFTTAGHICMCLCVRTCMSDYKYVCGLCMQTRACLYMHVFSVRSFACVSVYIFECIYMRVCVRVKKFWALFI